MNTVLYFSLSGAIYETRAYTKTDIAELIDHHGLQSLSSADRQLDFWFSPTTGPCQQRINAAATEMLLATSDFTARTVPLLRGCVVVATHDSDGDLDGLSWQQLDSLARAGRLLSKRDERVLARRIARDERRRQRLAESARPAAVRLIRPRTPAVH